VSRFTRFGFLFALLCLVGGGSWWLLHPASPYPHTHRVDGLQDSTGIRWSPHGLATIDAATPLDALTALGFVHGTTRGWTVTLWRRTARGQLGRWFGPGVLPIDRHARRLALAREAKRAYERLPAPQKERLRAYARGLNSALQSPRVQRQDAFVLHGVTPAPWQPWHTLAVERLLAWLATKPVEVPPEAPSAVASFREADRRLRRWLHLHGWSRSVAWAVRPSAADSARPPLFQRHVLGALATPVLQEVRLRWGRSSSIVGATMPGVPLMPTGTRGDTAWASLLRSPARLQQTPLDSANVRRRFERLAPSGHDENLLRVERLDGGLLLGTSPSTRPDSADTQPPPTAWTLQWSGFSAASDLPAWLDRAGLSPPDAAPAAFQLFAGDGLRTSAHDWTVLGSPPVVVRDSANRHVLVGPSPWARHQAHSLSAQVRSARSPAMARWSASDSSTWAARMLPGMTGALDRLTNTHPQFQDVVTYLRNWDYTYNAASIGATLFDQWMRAYRAQLGHAPTPADTSAYFATHRQHQALLQALDTLRTHLGPDVRRWRWERAVPDRRYFPVWSADSLVSADLSNLSQTRYAPLERSGRGHPSALAGGPSRTAPSPTAPSPTSWEGWVRSGDNRLTVRRYQYDPDAVFARSRMVRARPSPVLLSPDSTRQTTMLLPPRP